MGNHTVITDEDPNYDPHLCLVNNLYVLHLYQCKDRVGAWKQSHRAWGATKSPWLEAEFLAKTVSAAESKLLTEHDKAEGEQAAASDSNP